MWVWMPRRSTEAESWMLECSRQRVAQRGPVRACGRNCRPVAKVAVERFERGGYQELGYFRAHGFEDPHDERVPSGDEAGCETRSVHPDHGRARGLPGSDPRFVLDSKRSVLFRGNLRGMAAFPRGLRHHGAVPLY